MKVIAIFRKAFKPTPQREVTEFLMSQIHENAGIPPMALPSPFGVMSYLTTSKSVDEVKQALATNLSSHEFEVFEVPCDQLNPSSSSSSSSSNHANATMDEILDLIGEVGGVENLPQSAKDRLAQLRG